MPPVTTLAVCLVEDGGSREAHSVESGWWLHAELHTAPVPLALRPVSLLSPRITPSFLRWEVSPFWPLSPT